MRISHKSNAATGGASAHRGGGIDFVYLLEGEEGALDNYMLGLVSTESYTAPRHRHNFEQVRIMIKGEFGFGPGKVQDEGSVGYFCEGMPYTQRGDAFSTTLLLQVAGPSGSGYMSNRQLRQGVAELQKIGVFEDGVYSYVDENGVKHNQDGYEAAWEHINAREIVYPEPQYDAPIILRPDRFSWHAVEGQKGCSIRELGRFNDRGLSLAQVRVDAGNSWVHEAGERLWLLYFTEGEGTADGERWGAESAIELGKGEAIQLDCEEQALFYLIGLPQF
ncbi:MAG: hypothetical protein IBJ12_02545 [Sphingomonadaceae bacterium]|nr:hypothetical protein [Sphingomonadaceae bacterium]